MTWVVWLALAGSPVSVSELVERSTIVVEGRVLRSWTAWDSRHRYIWTHHEVGVVETLRGPAARTVIVSEPGGSIDGITMRLSHATDLESGEQAILFLQRMPNGNLRVADGGKKKSTPGLMNELRRISREKAQ